MHFGINCQWLLGADPSGEDVIRLAKRAEELGFRSFAIGDHVIIPACFDPSVYPGGNGFVGKSPWYDPFVLLSAVAGATKTIHLGTGIAVVPYRAPVQQAQSIATLDFMSGGRFWYGIGLGWMQEEFDALNIPFKERAPRTAEYLAVMKKLWAGDASPYQGKFVDFPGGILHPRPVQRPHPPIIVGGDGVPAYKRIVDIGTGFQFNFKTLTEFRSTISELGSMMASAGRALSELRMQLATTEVDLVRACRHELPEYAALGLSEIIFAPKAQSVDAGFAVLESIAREFIAQLSTKPG